MVSNSLLVVGYFCFISYGFLASGTNYRVQRHTNPNSNTCPITAIKSPSFSADSSSVDSGFTLPNAKIQSVLTHGEDDDGYGKTESENFKVLKRQSVDSVLASTVRDLNRMGALHARMVEMKRERTAERMRKSGGRRSLSERMIRGRYDELTSWVVVRGKELFREEAGNMSSEGTGGAIVAFMEEANGYPMVTRTLISDPCFNVSGLEKTEFGFVFGDGAVWDFPAENYFIRTEPEDVVCLSILEHPRFSLSIIGNYQHENFHVLYDMEKSILAWPGEIALIDSCLLVMWALIYQKLKSHNFLFSL